MRDKQGKLWKKLKKLKLQELEELGIQSCEMCGSSWLLDLAHSRKRRKIESEEQLGEVALLCRKCHDFIEYKISQPEMERVVKEIIDRRNPKDVLDA